MKNEHILEQFQRVINKVLFLKKKDLFEFEGIRFYPSEIHLMIVLDEKYSTNATKIGKRLGITKGAVSQTLSRLENKGVLNKIKDPHHKNELILTFTAFGQKVINFYKRQLAEMHKKQARDLSKFGPKEKKAIYSFLCDCEEILKDTF